MEDAGWRLIPADGVCNLDRGLFLGGLQELSVRFNLKEFGRSDEMEVVHTHKKLPMNIAFLGLDWAIVAPPLHQ